MSGASKNTGYDACDKELQDVFSNTTPFKLQSLEDIRNHRAGIQDTPESVIESYEQYVAQEYEVDGKMSHELLHLGGGVNVSIFTPKNRDPPASGRPCLYFIHGGGFVTNNKCSGIASIFPCICQLNAVCVSIEYGLAPECAATARLQQCYDGLLGFWEAKKDTGEINFDKLAVIGRSAGAALLVGMNLMLCDNKPGIKVRCNVMSFPMLDDDCKSKSHRDFGDAPHLPSASAKFFWKQQLDKCRKVDKYVVPVQAKAEDLHAFPPTLVEVGEADVLRDEGLEFCKKLNSAGVNVTRSLFNGYHCFDCTDTGISREAKQNRLQFFEEPKNGLSDFRVYGVPLLLHNLGLVSVFFRVCQWLSPL